ncbi:hypothetical protein JCM5350_005512 [Sporobolomyces pararoseus]
MAYQNLPFEYPPLSPVASTSKAFPPNLYLPLSSWISQGDYSHPHDDCLPVTPPGSSSPFKLEQSCFPSPFARSRSRAPSHSSIPFSDRQLSKFVESSGLASYRFPTGLPTPDSSRPNSPNRASFNPTQLSRCLDEDLQPSDHQYYPSYDVADDPEELEEEEEDEEEFKKRMLRERSMEFDGDMEEWYEGRSGHSSEWYYDEQEGVRNR